MLSLEGNETSSAGPLLPNEDGAEETSEATNLSSISDHGIALPVQSQVVLIVLYTATTFLSIIGNIVVIIVFTAGRRSRTDLRWFLINLAASDLIMAVFCMPFTFTMAMTGHWVFTAPMCPIVLYLQTVSVTASVFTNTAIGIDRFWVVGYPLKSRLMTRSRRSSLVIATVWVAALTLSSVQLIVGRSSTYDVGGVEVMDCNEVWPEPSALWRRAYTFFLLATTYACPFAVLLMTYSFVCQRLWRRTTPGNADEARDLQQLNSKRKVIKMLIVVVTLFGVCWLPLHAFFIVIDFHPELVDPEAPQHRAIFVALYYGVHWLAMSNSFVNPLIYGLFNDSFRHDLKWLLLKCMPCASTSSGPGCFPVTSSGAKPDPDLSTPTSLAMNYRLKSRRWLDADEGSSFPVATSAGRYHVTGSSFVPFCTDIPDVDN